jgi:hypothetical protein
MPVSYSQRRLEFGLPCGLPLLDGLLMSVAERASEPVKHYKVNFPSAETTTGGVGIITWDAR